MKIRLGNEIRNGTGVFLEGEDLFRGTYVTGATGMGKTTGVIQPFIRELFHAPERPGALILQCKDDYSGFVCAEAERTGQLDRVRIIAPFQQNPGGDCSGSTGADEVARRPASVRMNLLNSGADSQKISTQLMETVVAAGGGRDPREAFWIQWGMRVIDIAIESCRGLFGSESTTFDHVKAFIDGLNNDQQVDPSFYKRYQHLFEGKLEKDEVFENSFLALPLIYLQKQLDNMPMVKHFSGTNGNETTVLRELEELESRTLRLAHEISFLGEMDDRVKSSILSETYRVLYMVRDKDFSEVFCNTAKESNFSGMNEIFDDGRIVVVNFPPNRYGLAGTLVNRTLKSQFYSAALKRSDDEEIGSETRPVFLVCDECQNFISFGQEPESDNNFSSIARSLKVGLLLATQGTGAITAQGTSNNETACFDQFLNNMRTHIYLQGDHCEATQKQFKMRHLDEKTTDIVAGLKTFECLLLRDSRTDIVEIEPEFGDGKWHSARRKEDLERVHQGVTTSLLNIGVPVASLATESPTSDTAASSGGAEGVGHRALRILAGSTDRLKLMRAARKIEVDATDLGYLSVRINRETLKQFGNTVNVEEKKNERGGFGRGVLEKYAAYAVARRFGVSEAERGVIMIEDVDLLDPQLLESTLYEILAGGPVSYGSSPYRFSADDLSVICFTKLPKPGKELGFAVAGKDLSEGKSRKAKFPAIAPELTELFVAVSLDEPPHELKRTLRRPERVALSLMEAI